MTGVYFAPAPDGPYEIAPPGAPTDDPNAIGALRMGRLYLTPQPDGPYEIALPAAARPDAHGIPDALSAVIPDPWVGVPTLEAQHRWDDDVTIHGHDELDPETRPWRCQCQSISLRSLPDAELPADPWVGGVGTIARPGRRGGRTAVYTGRVQAVDAASLRIGVDTVIAAGWDVTAERTMRITYQGREWMLRGRPHVTTTDLTSLPLTAVPTPYQADLVVAITMSDPRIYVATEAASYPDHDNIAVIGGAIPTAPTIRIHGPITNPTVTDQTRDVVLVLDHPIPADAWVDIDLRARELRSSDGEDLYDQLAWPASTWWSTRYADVLGPLQLTLTGTATGPSTRLEIRYHPAA